MYIITSYNIHSNTEKDVQSIKEDEAVTDEDTMSQQACR